MLPKPETCSGCDLYERGRGYVPASGPTSSPLLFLGEAPGEREVIEGNPFVGPAGGVLHRLAYLLDQDSSTFRKDNCVRCQPPANKLAGMPWEAGAVFHCKQYSDQTLREQGLKVVVATGGTAIRRLLGITRGGGFSVEDFHGTCTWSEEFQLWVTATFHPSHLQRGAMNLFGTVLWDLRRALDLAYGRWAPAPAPSLVIDPDPEWFERWVDDYCAAAERDPEGVWLATDCETPDTASKLNEGELTAQDRSYHITHVNLSCNPEEGVTVPFVEPYVSLIRKAHASRGWKIVWSKYDPPRYKFQKVPLAGRVLDFLDAWHVLQSDVPRGLGYVSPFYCPWAIPWKHLGSGSGIYRAFDGVNTLVNAYGIAQDLQAKGQWETYLEDVVDWQEWTVDPLQEVGLLLDEPATVAFGEKLKDHARGFWAGLQEGVPEQLKPLVPKGGWKTDPGPEKDCEGFAGEKGARPTVKVMEKHPTLTCLGCGVVGGITKKHRCKDKALQPQVVAQELEVPRWYVRGDFNPGSSPQKLALMKFFHDKPGRNKDTGKPSADKVTIGELAKHSKSLDARKLYRLILDFQSVRVVKSTYVDGTLKRLEQDRQFGTYDGRLHPTLTNKPSTMRPSCTAPNLFNVRADKDGKQSLAAGFKKCIVAAEGCQLVELDWVGQEAVFTGFYAGDPGYIRLATLGIHDFFNAYQEGKPADLAWDDEKLGEYLAWAKEEFEETRDPCKRTVHGKNYGLTWKGMFERFPWIFQTAKMAKEYSAAFDRLFPCIVKFHETVMELANKQHYLGGAGQHPFNYVHWFWDVYSFRKITPSAYRAREIANQRRALLRGVPYAVDDGGDSNRVKAFFSQSTNAAVLRKTCRKLFNPASPDFIGDVFYGRTPLRAPIYDSLLLEIPTEKVDRVVEVVAPVMMAPIRQMPLPPEWGLGEFLTLRVDAKIGRTWGDMKKLSLKGLLPGAVDVEETLVDEEWEESDEWGDDGPQDWGGGWTAGQDREAAGDVPF